MSIKSKLLLTLTILPVFLHPFDLLAQESVSRKDRPTIGLILSGGGAKGLAHVGVLKVLEEAGIKPDFIGGTSMGSIVGGLYAIGYDADSLEKIARSADWNTLLSDNVPRTNLTIEEKEDEDRFFVSFPIKENKIRIPSGLVNGQNIENYFNELCAPVYNIRDFNDFQIPYLCIATDIETGEEVVFQEGYLPHVMRASMSIPSVFNPIEINNRLLVDGGIVNNFPVAKIRDLGADILIGVDVGFRYYKKDELNSIFRILEQSVFFYGEALNEYNESLCDILIEPDLTDYNSSSFSSVNPIIDIGEAEARKHIDQFRAIADSVYGDSKPDFTDHKLPKLDSLHLMEIRVKGLNKVSGKLLNGKLQLEVLNKYTPKDISHAVERLYSSLYFDKIHYTLEPLDYGSRLNLNVQEARGGDFRLGLHYDTNYRSAILLNTTYRNLLFDGSKFSASLSLGENPFFQASFFKNNGWKPGFGINFFTSRLDAFVYESGRQISSLAYAETKTQVFTQSILSNSYAFGLGIEYEAARISPKIDPVIGIQETTSDYWNYYAELNFDSYDNLNFPTKGVKMRTLFKVITKKDLDPTAFLVGRYSVATPLHRNITLINHVYGGAVEGDSIPYQYNFYTGGINTTPRYGILPFAGLSYMERMSRNVLLLGADLQIEVFPDIYLKLKANIGNITNDFKELLNTDRLYGGYGLSLGYDSWIGPIEMSLLKGTRKEGTEGFFNIGIWF